MNISYDGKLVDKILKIEKDECLCKGIKRRFLLDIKLKNKDNEKPVVVIAMNPSKADEVVSDRTINKIIKYIYYNEKTKEYGRILILNLFVAYASNPEEINNLINKSNFNYVAGNDKKEDDSVITNNDYIIKTNTRAC